jgi:hypothetical protein
MMTTTTIPTTPTIAPRRRYDWQLRLAALINQRMATPLAWGTHDCCLFAADAVLACTGADLAADLRGSYHSEAEAQVLLESHGGLIALAAARLGRAVRTELAQAGDIGLAVLEGRPTLALCGGPVFLAPGHSGLVPLAPNQVLRAWRCTGEVA